MKLDGYLEKLKKRAEKKSTKYQFQEIALEIAKELNASPKDQKILFRFIKTQFNKGMWWKIKEVREYMQTKKIRSVRYFMASFRKKKDT